MAWGVGSIVAPIYISKVGLKKCLIIGGFSNTAYMISSIIATISDNARETTTSFFTSSVFVWSIIVLWSIVCGFINGPYYVAMSQIV